MQVAVIDSGGANVGSVLQALKRSSIEGQLTQSKAIIESADRVILPGVGTAHAAMATLREHKLIDTIRGLTQPVLGICLGLQLLFESSSEGEQHTECLGVIPGLVDRLPSSPTRRLPHMGWNQLKWTADDPLARYLNDQDWFYFVHSYAVAFDQPATIATADHGISFAAVVRHKNFWATQFHPEKSAGAGQRLLQGFLDL
jgi:glutamine amidotransferase